MTYDDPLAEVPEISEEMKSEIIRGVRGLGVCMGSDSAGYGMTIENDARIWRISGWSLDSMAHTLTVYGRTLNEAWAKYMDDDPGEDDELLEAEWEARAKEINE